MKIQFCRSDCSSRGGVKSGTCASGFGVCCIFSVGCGGASSENCTYFEATSVGDGECKATICKTNPGICQVLTDSIVVFIEIESAFIFVFIDKIGF